jgi:lipopolysaccharide export system protein LptA
MLGRSETSAASAPAAGRAAAILIALGLMITATPIHLRAQDTAYASHEQAVPPDSPPPSGEVTVPDGGITRATVAPAVASLRKAHPVVAAKSNLVGGAPMIASAATQPDSSPTNGAFMPFGSTQKGPVNIQSDGLDLDYKNNWVLFHGHVHAVQNGGVLTSDSLRVKYGKDFSQVQQMFADGNVKITQGTRWATSDHAVLDQAMHTVTLTGNPVVHDGDNRVVGQKIVFNMITGKSEVTGGAKAWFFPRDSKSPNNNAATVGKAD